MNPLLGNEHYVPDVEARVWNDGRLYIYGSYDIREKNFWCSDVYHVFSTDNLVDWVDHGISLDANDISWLTIKGLYAPDCVFKDGKYYLFFCMGGDGGREGVAISDKPYGPFKNPVPIQGADGFGIDPAVLVDDDGKAYLYWGQENLKGALLSDDMTSIIPETLNNKLLKEEKDGFHEGACIRKINDKYYLVYTDVSRGRATCLSYAISDSPLGPFEKKGILIDNTYSGKLSWNNHGSICAYKDQWYIFYHCSSLGNIHNRRLWIEPITINQDGTINEVQMTTQGAEPPISAKNEMSAYRACFMYGNVSNGFENGEEILTGAKTGDYVSYKYLMFSKEKAFTAVAKGKGNITVYTDSPFWRQKAYIEINSENEWETVTVPFPEEIGIHSVYLRFAGENISIKSFRFE
jgi:arabinoxylan arabinofuranohydrolase